MNKPDWKNAPEWANWLAMDENKVWYWYQFRPIKPSCESNDTEDGDWSTKSGNWPNYDRWEVVASLEKRPE